VAEAAFPTIRDVDHRMAVIAPSAQVSSRAAIGAPAEWRDRETRYPAVIHAEAIVREYVRVHAGCDNATSIGKRTLLMAGSHIGHDTRIGADCEIAPNAVVGGCCTIGAQVRIGMGAVILPGVQIGDNARIGAGAVITKDVPAGQTWVGNPGRRMGPQFGVR